MKQSFTTSVQLPRTCVGSYTCTFHVRFLNISKHIWIL